MNGVAVSVYDKFEEVRVLADILKENWSEDYYLVVCCFHPDAEEELEGVDIDELITGPEIGFDSGMEGYSKDIHLTARILQSIKLSCRAAMDAGCDYVMHTHADAWPMNEKKFLKVIEGMREKDRKVAGKGNMTINHPDQRLGGISDMFVFFESEFMREIDFFEYNPLDLMPHYLLRDIFVMILLAEVGRSNIWLFYDGSKDEFWDGEVRRDWEKGTVPHVRPIAYNPEWGFLHVNTEDFLGNDGGKVQAMYLREYGLTEGENIKEFLEAYEVPKEELLHDLSTKEDRLNRRMKYVGIFKPEKYGYNRNFVYKKEVLHESLPEKFLRLSRNIARFVYFKSHKVFFKMPFTDQILPEEKQTFQRDLQRQDYYMQSEWPKTDKEIYRENVDLNEFPEGYREDWISENE